MNFTNQGQTAIEKFNNDELLEIFTRYSKTLTKKYSVDVTVPEDINQDIIVDRVLKISLENVECDAITFLKELGRDIKVPLKKRLGGKLDNVFKIVMIE